MSQNHPIISGIWQLISSVMIQVSFTNRVNGKGHLRSCEVISSLLPINRDTMVLKTCKRYQTARLVKTRRLTCNMTITPAPIGSWSDLDLSSSLNWSMKVIMYMFRFVSTRETQWCQSHVSIFLSSKVIQVTISKTFYTWWPLVTSILTWLEQFLCKSCRSLSDLSNAVCRLSLRCLVFEIWWGGANRLPPPRIEPFRARPEYG